MTDPLFDPVPVFGGGWVAIDRPHEGPLSPGRSTRRAFSKQLPYRYGKVKAYDFVTRFGEALEPGITVLDAGSGKIPAYRWFHPPGTRATLPERIEYVGLDLSASELREAGDGAYDEFIVGDLCVHQPELDGRFDVIVSHQVLEHVPSLEDALENLRRYLRPGGRMISIFSSRNAWFSRVDRFIPFRAKTFAMERLLHRDPASVFPAHFDRCTHADIVALMREWSTVEVVPSFLGVNYTHFSRALTAVNLIYEEWAIRNDRLDLATHYVVDATR